MHRLTPLHMEVRPLPAHEIEKVADLIRATKTDLNKVTGVDVVFLADVVHDNPELFSPAYQEKFGIQK